jgi:hypothetical protein
MSGGSEPHAGTPLHQLRAAQRKQPDDILATKVGLRIPEGLSFVGWERAGQQISRVVDSAAWCLGDWLVWGQQRYADRYRHAVARVGLDYQTLRNYAWVARRFELFRRRVELSFQHHAEVASMPPDQQDMWLAQAARLGWSRNQLRQAVHDGREIAEPGAENKTVLPRMQVPQQAVERWQRAAQQSRSDLRQWVVETLDSAAALVLSDLDHTVALQDDPTDVGI